MSAANALSILRASLHGDEPMTHGRLMKCIEEITGLMSAAVSLREELAETQKYLRADYETCRRNQEITLNAGIVAARLREVNEVLAETEGAR